MRGVVRKRGPRRDPVRRDGKVVGEKKEMNGGVGGGDGGGSGMRWVKFG